MFRSRNRKALYAEELEGKIAVLEVRWLVERAGGGVGNIIHDGYLISPKLNPSPHTQHPNSNLLLEEEKEKLASENEKLKHAVLKVWEPAGGRRRRRRRVCVCVCVLSVSVPVSVLLLLCVCVCVCV